MSLLAALNQAGVLRALDDALARSLCRLDPKTPDKVAAAAALASMAVAHGHAGVDLAHPGLLAGEMFDWPSAADWVHLLRASRWVAEPSEGRHQHRLGSRWCLSKGCSICVAIVSMSGV